MKNISSLNPSKVREIRSTLELELERKGFKSDLSGSPVRVTFSEGEEKYVWVAEVDHDDGKQISIVNLQITASQDLRSQSAPVLSKRSLWQQSDLFLDFSEKFFTKGFIRVFSVLEPDRVANYEGQVANYAGFVAGTLRFSGARPFTQTLGSRDIRGRLVAPENGSMKAFVGGTVCIIEDLASCKPVSPGEWPVGDGWRSTYVYERNYFRGLPADVTGIRGKQPSFFSLSRLEYDHGSDWLLSGLDGATHMEGNLARPTAAIVDWGDEIATVKPGCGPSWQVLVAGTGDWTKTDRLQLFDIEIDQARAIGQPLEFSGPILTLWASDDGKSARVVSRNLQTGMYEASIVSVSCSN